VPPPAEVSTYEIPFEKNVEVICDQGALSPKGNSHTWQNTAYALDLQSGLNAKIVAVGAGEVIAFNGCKTLNDQCGLGFGNQVKILTPSGDMLFYAHLKDVSVRTGHQVKVGDVLGIEGETGWAGKANPHLHFSVHSDWREKGREYWKNVGFLPPSVPFQLQACFKSSDTKCEARDVREIQCRRVAKEPGRIFRR
jgi:murein DD-endopeptidase MepM/ murein hydrolase activator NlpD